MIRAGTEIGMTQQPGESDAVYAIRSHLAKQRVEQLTTLLNESKEILLGLKVEPAEGTAHLDFELTAQDDTKLAEKMARIKPGKTNFAGLMMPDAAVAANWVRTLGDDDVARAKTMLAALREAVTKEIEKQGLSPEPQSFERIHRSNLVGMGVLPLQFKEGVNAQTLKLNGSETYDVLGLGPGLKPQQDLTLRITRANGQAESIPVTCRIDTPIEIDYYQHGGILPFVLRQLIATA